MLLLHDIRVSIAKWWQAHKNWDFCQADVTQTSKWSLSSARSSCDIHLALSDDSFIVIPSENGWSLAYLLSYCVPLSSCSTPVRDGLKKALKTGNKRVKERVNALCNRFIVPHRTLCRTVAEKKKKPVHLGDYGKKKALRELSGALETKHGTSSH